MKEEYVIEIKDLSFTYHGTNRKALRNIGLTIAKGEFVGITGPTGAGKTTLSLCLNGVIPHFTDGVYEGDVLIKGRPVFETKPQELSRFIGSVFQDPEAQIISANVEEEIAFGPENLAIPEPEIEKRIDLALSAVGIEELRNAPISSLSGGQKQRVAIAAVLAMLPEVIVLDEPTAELDPVGTEDVFATLKRLNEEMGITIVIIEHKMEHLSEYCRRLLVMDDGEVVLDGEPARIFTAWRELYALGVKPPQVAEFVGRFLEDEGTGGEIPVTLEAAVRVMDNILSRFRRDEEW